MKLNSSPNFLYIKLCSIKLSYITTIYTISITISSLNFCFNSEKCRTKRILFGKSLPFSQETTRRIVIWKSRENRTAFADSFASSIAPGPYLVWFARLPRKKFHTSRNGTISRVLCPISGFTLSNKSLSSCSVKRHLVRDRVSPEENTLQVQRLQRVQRVMKTVYCAKGIRLCLKRVLH